MSLCLCPNVCIVYCVCFSDFAQKLSVALSENPASVIHSLNLAHNTLDNQGTKQMSYFPVRLTNLPISVLVTSLLPLSLSVGVGVSNLIQQVCRLSKGLRLLNLSKTSLNSKGLDCFVSPSFHLSISLPAPTREKAPPPCPPPCYGSIHILSASPDINTGQ